MNSKRRFKKVFDSIFKTSSKIARTYGEKTIPIKMLSIIIDRFKLPIEGSKDIKEFNEQYNHLLDVLFSECKQLAENAGYDKIPLVVLKKKLNTIKPNFA